MTLLAGPHMAHDIEATGCHRARPPLSPSDLPYPAVELATWADCLVPAGIHEALAVALIAGGRHVGFLALLSGDVIRRPPRRGAPSAGWPHGWHGPSTRCGPWRSRLLWSRGQPQAWSCGRTANPAMLPGLADHPLLAVGSAVTAVARAAIRAGRSYCSFLGPVGGRHAPGGHLRVTVLACSEPVPLHLVGLVLLSSPGDLRGLTPRELEILGLLVDGGSNGEIARTLVVAQRTVAAHLKHILAKLSAPSRTLAAVCAERAGLYVPCRPAAARRR